MFRSQTVENAVGEIAGSCSHLNDREACGRAQLNKYFREITRESRCEQRTGFRRSSIISGAALPYSISPAVVTVSLVVQRGLHPIPKSNRAFALDTLAKSFS
jgi:hypothetical protein